MAEVQPKMQPHRQEKEQKTCKSSHAFMLVTYSGQLLTTAANCFEILIEVLSVSLLSRCPSGVFSQFGTVQHPSLSPQILRWNNSAGNLQLLLKLFH